MTETPVTVVLAAYNHRRFIRRALEAVAAQTLAPKLIVTDDASRDGSPEVIEAEMERLGLTAQIIFHRTNRGICATFNEALALVETPLVAFISADDWMAPRRVELQAERLLAEDDSTALVYGDMVTVDSDGNERGTWSVDWSPATALGLAGQVYLELLRNNFIPTPSVMLRTTCVRAVGGYDEALPFEDLDMWYRLAREFTFTFLAEPLVYYRMHADSMSATAQRDDTTILDAHIRILTKQMGHSPEADEVILPRLFDATARRLKAGPASPALAGPLFAYALRYRSARAAAFAAAAGLRLPVWRLIKGTP